MRDLGVELDPVELLVLVRDTGEGAFAVVATVTKLGGSDASLSPCDIHTSSEVSRPEKRTSTCGAASVWRVTFRTAWPYSLRSPADTFLPWFQAISWRP